MVSTDTDFIQLLPITNVKLYNPVTKKFVVAPPYDYVVWKALRGDGSDNVPALVTEGEALRLVQGDASGAPVTFDGRDPAQRAALMRNLQLISFMKWDNEEAKLMQSSSPSGPNWDRVKERFGEWAFQSMLKDSYWPKFQATFDPLWG